MLEIPSGLQMRKGTMMEPLLCAEQVSKEFAGRRGKTFRALGPVTLSLYPGETLGVVGESGCGKSTLARVIMGAYEPTQGRILFEGKPVNFSSRRERLLFASQVQMVFQDPLTALNPRMTVTSIVEENLRIQGMRDEKALGKRVEELLAMVGLDNQHSDRFPHELSGGQRQRVGIARALASKPRLLVCDEPLSALDISIQSQIVNLLKGLKEEYGLTYLFIAHDLSMVRYLSDRIAVLYGGRLVELAESEALFKNPLHPYTKMLLDAILIPEPGTGRLDTCGTDPSADSWEQPEHGCPFVGRCKRKVAECVTENPELRQIEAQHFAACHRV